MMAALGRIELEYPVASPTCDEVTNAMDRPMCRIMELSAKTTAGLAVKARVARFACEHFWHESDEDADWDHKMARKLIDAVLHFNETT
jgi:hypothetical protein